MAIPGVPYGSCRWRGKWKSALEKDTWYGLIHQDVHTGNLLVDKSGNMVLFDFDDCAHSWFVNDIAIVLFYAVMGMKDRIAFTREFMQHFMRGYRKENGMEADRLQVIPHFLKLREIDLYAIIHRSFDVNKLDDPWCERYMKGRKQRIENGVPYIDFDFESLGGNVVEQYGHQGANPEI